VRFFWVLCFFWVLLFFWVLCLPPRNLLTDIGLAPGCRDPGRERDLDLERDTTLYCEGIVYLCLPRVILLYFEGGYPLCFFCAIFDHAIIGLFIVLFLIGCVTSGASDDGTSDDGASNDGANGAGVDSLIFIGTNLFSICAIFTVSATMRI